MRRQKSFKYRLMEGKKPVSWSLPLKQVLLKNPMGRQKHIHYIQSADTIFVEDYKGDEKPKKIIFEDGLLLANPDDKNLLEILNKHPWYGKKYERIDEDKDAEKELDLIEKKEIALSKVNIADATERKAHAFVLLGQSVTDYSEKRIKAELKKLADKDPQKVITEMAKENYQNKYIACLAILRGVIVVNETRTAISWEKGDVIVRVAVGHNPIDRLADFLSEDTEDAVMTLQTIGEKIKRAMNLSKMNQGEEEIKSAIENKSLDALPLEDIHTIYVNTVGKNVPLSKKNDKEWLIERINSLQEE